MMSIYINASSKCDVDFVCSSMHIAAYSVLICATVSSCEQTPVIFKRLHLKCNLIICQIATKSFPLQLGDGG